MAQTRLGDEIIVVANAGQPDDHTPPVLMGQRAPFIAPFGTVFVAWFPEKQREEWITRQPHRTRDEDRRNAIAAVRRSRIVSQIDGSPILVR